MTQKEKKQLLLQDLSARLPYRVVVDYAYNAFDVHKGHYVKKGTNCILTCYLLDTFISPRQNENGEYIKPYLIPLSKMTEEQKKEYDSIIYGGIELHSERYYDVIDIDDFETLMDFYHKHHLDYRGLIRMGLANDATNLNIY